MSPGRPCRHRGQLATRQACHNTGLSSSAAPRAVQQRGQSGRNEAGARNNAAEWVKRQCAQGCGVCVCTVVAGCGWGGRGCCTGQPSSTATVARCLSARRQGKASGHALDCKTLPRAAASSAGAPWQAARGAAACTAALGSRYMAGTKASTPWQQRPLAGAPPGSGAPWQERLLAAAPLTGVRSGSGAPGSSAPPAGVLLHPLRDLGRLLVKPLAPLRGESLQLSPRPAGSPAGGCMAGDRVDGLCMHGRCGKLAARRAAARPAETRSRQDAHAQTAVQQECAEHACCHDSRAGMSKVAVALPAQGDSTRARLGALPCPAGAPHLQPRPSRRWRCALLPTPQPHAHRQQLPLPLRLAPAAPLLLARQQTPRPQRQQQPRRRCPQALPRPQRLPPAVREPPLPLPAPLHAAGWRRRS